MSSEDKSFSQDYVNELREEAKNWRIKVRELESEMKELVAAREQMSLLQVKNELLSQGINAEPDWVKIDEGQSVQEAVAAFGEKHPALKSAGQPAAQPSRNAPAPMAKPATNSDTPGPAPRKLGVFGKTLEEAKQDPKAREELRTMYRQLLRQNSNQPTEG